MNTLAKNLRTLNRLEEAHDLYMQAFKLTADIHGPEHPDTLMVMNNWAVCKRRMGDAWGAMEVYEYVLEVRERVLGPEHKDTLTTLGNMGACWEAVDCPAVGLPLHQQALEAAQRTLDSEDELLVMMANNLGNCYASQNPPQYEDAMQVFEQAAEMAQRVFPNHPNTQALLSNMEACRARMQAIPADA